MASTADVYLDAFGRIQKVVHEAVEGLSAEQLNHRVEERANSITWLVWHLFRLVDRERCCHEVAPGLWLGRRPFVRELPPGIALVVDLTAEFAAPTGIRHGREYLCVPTLDATAPDECALRQTIERILAHKGPVYVHCAQGRGRSALVAAGVLVQRGLALDATQAEGILRGIRSCVKLTPGQRRMLGRITPDSAFSDASRPEG